MASYKDPDFNERVGRAAAAKQKALESLKAKPKIDEAVVAEKRAAFEARQAAAEEKRAAKLAAIEQAKAEKAAIAAEKAAAAQRAVPTEAEKKAARDARYAARKGRK